MKIFSNFDTHAPLEAYQKALAEYGADKVIFVRRDKIYLTFFIVLPAIAVGLLFIGAFVLMWNLSATFFSSLFLNVVFAIFFWIMAIMVIMRIIMNYINFLLDYTIITPALITSYNQTWLFRREIRTLDTDKIKTITISGKTLLQSMFNFWSIVILSEGDDDQHGDITLHFLNNPSVLKDEIVRIINLKKDD